MGLAGRDAEIVPVALFIEITARFRLGVEVLDITATDFTNSQVEVARIERPS